MRSIGIVLVAVAALTGVMSTTARAVSAGYSCDFTDGETWSFEKGRFDLEQSTALAFRIADVDLERQTARLGIATSGVQLKVVPALDAQHFIEVTVGGFLNITTIYGGGDGGRRPAVHSRHVGIVGQPLVAQYRGTCRVL